MKERKKKKIKCVICNFDCKYRQVCKCKIKIKQKKNPKLSTLLQTMNFAICSGLCSVLSNLKINTSRSQIFSSIQTINSIQKKEKNKKKVECSPIPSKFPFLSPHHRILPFTYLIDFSIKFYSLINVVVLVMTKLTNP